MDNSAADRNLLFGLLALQNGLIDQVQLVAAFQAWTLEKDRPLADHLVARGDLDDDDRAAVDALVARHLKKHGGSAAKSLAALPARRSTQRSLAALHDPELATSLAGVPVGEGGLDSGGEPTFDIGPEPVAVDGGSVLARLAVEIGMISRVALPDADATDRGLAVNDGDGDSLADASAGRFRLLGEIARGGMGAVHRGRDVDLGRDLALKVLLDRHRDRPDLVGRFVEEAQICGQLQHPGVVPVYELGTMADRRPFFAMKLVKGRTLAELLGERGRVSAPSQPRQTPGADGTGLAGDLPRFLSIFEAVCQTVAYAHARGVIHRDLKPSNVMVGSFGEVQVMDWGLAKVLPRDGQQEPAREPVPNETVIATARSTGDGDLSQTGSVLGTPAYMAPEQARGETESIDRRADVFALGSILCEILSGAPAFSGASAREILGAAGRGDTAAAMARLASCAADAELLTLARDCLAAEAKDRPADAGAVAARITAYLAGVQERLREAELSRAAESARAVEALAKAAAERQARRLTGALAATVLLACGLGAAGWRWAELQRLGRLREASGRVNLALQEATRLRGLAQGAAVEDPGPWAVAAVAAEKARDLLEPGIEPTLRKQVENLAAALAAERGQTEAAAEGARRDRELLDRLVDIRSAEADDRDGSSTDAAYADAFRESGVDLAALSAEEAAKRMRSRPPAVATALASAVDDWTAIRRDRRKDRAGAASLAAIVRAADADDWRNRLRRALDQPDAAARRTALQDLAGGASYETLGPVSLDLLGRALSDAADPAGAESVLRRAQQRYPGDVWINYDLARALEKLARRDEAIRYYTAARSLRPETAHEMAHALGHKGEGNEEIAVLEDLRRLRPKNGRHLGCLGIALKGKGRSQEAEAILEEAVAAHREAIRVRPNEASVHTNLGLALQEQGKADEAIAEFRTAIRFQPDNAGAHLNLGNALVGLAKLDEAIAEFRTAIRFQPDLANAHDGLGRALERQGKRDEAIAEYRTAIRVQPDSASAHTNLGVALLRLGKLDEACAEYRSAIRIQPDLATAHNNLGASLIRQGKLDEAIAEFRAAIRFQPDYADSHHGLGVVLKTQGKLDEAIAEFRTAIRFQPDYAAAHDNLGTALYEQGKLDEAIVELRTAIRIQPIGRAMAREHLGLALMRQENMDEAIAEFRSAIRVQPDDVESQYNLGFALGQQGKLDEAIAAYRTSIRILPDHGWGHNGLAWVLVKNPPRTAWEMIEALEHARKAVALSPKMGGFHNTLALAEYRIGNWAESVVAAERSIALLKGVDAGNWFFLAMALWQRGEQDRSCSYFDQAVALTKKSDPRNAELLAFWREAALLLGQPGPGAAPLPDLPGEVFAR